MKQEEAQKLKEFSDAIDKKIEEDLKKEIPTPKPEEIIKENPPLPELDVIKFAMEKGNDEIALWLREGKESGFLDEVMIGIALMKYECPMIFEPEYSCLVHRETWKELFHHFKDIHYSNDANVRHAKHLFYNYWTRTFINDKTTEHQKFWIQEEARNPSTNQLKPYIETVERRTKWKDTAYAMLQECFVYEANVHDGIRTPKVKARKKAAVLYRMQKVYGLTTKQIAKIFDNTNENTRKLIYNGMMYEHGNNEKNLPTWMQNVLKKD